MAIAHNWLKSLLVARWNLRALVSYKLTEQMLPISRFWVSRKWLTRVVQRADNLGVIAGWLWVQWRINNLRWRGCADSQIYIYRSTRLAFLQQQEAARQKRSINRQLGNVAIGTASPNFAQFGSNTGGTGGMKMLVQLNGQIDIVNTNSGNLITGYNRGFIKSLQSMRLAMIFGVGSSGTERMRIDSSGRLLVGATMHLLTAMLVTPLFKPLAIILETSRVGA